MIDANRPEKILHHVQRDNLLNQAHVFRTWWGFVANFDPAAVGRGAGTKQLEAILPSYRPKRWAPTDHGSSRGVGAERSDIIDRFKRCGA